MTWPPQEHQYWIIEPLLDAGLPLERVTALVFRLGFEATMCQGTLADITRLVLDEPVAVQAAWHRTMERLLSIPAPAPEPPERVVRAAGRAVGGDRPGIPEPRRRQAPR